MFPVPHDTAVKMNAACSDLFFTRSLANLPNLSVDDVHRIVNKHSPAPQSKREKGFKFYISQYIHNFEGKCVHREKAVVTFLVNFC